VEIPRVPSLIEFKLGKSINYLIPDIFLGQASKLKIFSKFIYFTAKNVLGVYFNNFQIARLEKATQTLFLSQSLHIFFYLYILQHCMIYKLCIAKLFLLLLQWLGPVGCITER